eukprot:s611_g3.t1
MGMESRCESLRCGAPYPLTMLLAPQSPTSQSDQDSAQSGQEPGTQEFVYWGYDLKPGLPPALGASIVAGAVSMALVQIPLLCRLHTWSQAEAPLIAVEVGLAAVTVVLMGYCSWADPGQLTKTRNIALDGIDLEQGERPFRAHESWQYGRKIRRYDHYCKWVNNTIGLLNHREFVLMLVGLCLIGLFGVVLDGYLALLLAQQGLWEKEVMVVSHLAYSVGLLAIELPIFRIHIGLVSRSNASRLLMLKVVLLLELGLAHARADGTFGSRVTCEPRAMVSGGSSRVLRSYIRSHKVAAGGPSSTPPRRRSSSGLPLQHGFQQAAAFATSGTAVLNLPPHLPMASSKVWTMRILGQLQRPASAPGIWSLAQLWRMWTRSCFFSSLFRNIRER